MCVKTKCGVRRLGNEQWYLASISRLLKHIDNDEICDRKCDTRRPRSGTTAIIEQVEGMIRTTSSSICHIVFKALVKFVLVSHGGHV